MPTRDRLRLVPTLAAVLLVAAQSGAPAHAQTGTLEPYRTPVTPPPLDLEDIRGQNHALEDYRGQVVLVNFWASWCAPCVWELPSMGRLSDRLEGQPFTLLAVDVGESKGEVFRFIGRLGGTRFPVLLDRDKAAFRDWLVETLPTSFLIDAEGRARYRAIGAREWDDDETLSVIQGLMKEGRASATRPLPVSHVPEARPDTPPR